MEAAAEPRFPDPRHAPRRGPQAGLVAVGGELSVARLLAAYRAGIFPWSVAPITWWSPDPRGIFELTDAGLHLPRSLARVLRQGRFEVTFNRAFGAVIEGCARQPRPGSWLSRPFVQAYTALHAAGFAHSVECWRADKLAGGLYGVGIGGLFAGESMFHAVNDASKVAVVAAHRRLRERGFQLFDIQMLTETTGALGAVEISRDEYLNRLAAAVKVECRFE